MHKTRNLFSAKTAQKGSGFLILRYFFVQIAIAFLFCNSPFVLKNRRLRFCCQFLGNAAFHTSITFTLVTRLSGLKVLSVLASR